MTPYYQDDAVTIYHGDCLDVLPTLKMVDLVVADPPYLFGLGSTAGKVGWGDLMNSAFWYAAWLKHIRRLTESSSGAAWVFNSWRSYPVLSKASYDVQWPITSLLVWDKDWIGPGGEQGLRPQFELVALFANPSFSIPNRCTGDVWRIKWSTTQGLTGHRAEKPEALIGKLITESHGHLVLDPFMGSGTTLRAAKNLGRRAIGIDSEEAYCEIAAKRMAQEVFAFTP